MVAEEISVNGEKYVLSRVAARLTKYSNDYIGELCRSGKVTAKQVGKLWYVEKNSLLSYQKENGKQGFGAQKIMAAKKLLDKKNNDATVQTSFAAKKIISPFRFRGLEPKMIALTVALLVPLTSYLVVTGGIPITERPLGRDAVSEVARSKFASALTLSSAYDGFTGVFRKAGDALSSFFFGDMLVPPTIIVKQDESRETKEKVTALEIELEKLKKEKTTAVVGTVSSQKITERIIEKSAVTPKDLEILSNALRSEMYRLTSQSGFPASANFVNIAPVSRIDTLQSVSVSNSTITNSSFAGSVSGTSGSFNDLSVTTLSAGATTLSNLTVTGSFSANNNLFTISGTTTATNQFIAALIPTQAHTFGTWLPGVANSAASNATLYVNPASAAADTNLLGLAVGDSVKMLVDAEGDLFVNSLTSVGATSLSTTTASSFT
ncbi:MAG: hypothetical protein AAB355_01635, partial [Patescibacteria group bacterium]